MEVIDTSFFIKYSHNNSFYTRTIILNKNQTEQKSEKQANQPDQEALANIRTTWSLKKKWLSDV